MKPRDAWAYATRLPIWWLVLAVWLVLLTGVVLYLLDAVLVISTTWSTYGLPLQKCVRWWER